MDDLCRDVDRSGFDTLMLLGASARSSYAAAALRPPPEGLVRCLNFTSAAWWSETSLRRRLNRLPVASNSRMRAT